MTVTASVIARFLESTIPQGAWFARGSGHNEKAQYSERPDDYKNNLDRLRHKFEHARNVVPKPEIVSNDGHESASSPTALRTTHWSRPLTNCRPTTG